MHMEVLLHLAFFKPNPRVIKTRIEGLIEREYSERSAEDSQVYNVSFIGCDGYVCTFASIDLTGFITPNSILRKAFLDESNFPRRE